MGQVGEQWAVICQFPRSGRGGKTVNCGRHRHSPEAVRVTLVKIGDRLDDLGNHSFQVQVGRNMSGLTQFVRMNVSGTVGGVEWENVDYRRV
jgi:hypothetical protein